MAEPQYIPVDYDPFENAPPSSALGGASDNRDMVIPAPGQVRSEFGQPLGENAYGNLLENLPADVKSGERKPTKAEIDQAYQAYLVSSGEIESRQVEGQFRNENWIQLPTQMKGFPAPDKQLVRRSGSNSLGIGEPYQSVTPVDHDPFATEPYDLAVKDYPTLKDQGITAVPGRGGSMEFWSPNEPGTPDRPRPDSIPMDQPGIELGKNDRPLDVLGDIVSHHMVKKDPVIKKFYEGFVNSLTPDQKGRLQQQYQYAVQNEGEQRSYEKWEEMSGIPAYFRGYAFKQWPDEFNQIGYTPEQRAHFDQMMNYLQRPQENKPQKPQSALGVTPLPGQEQGAANAAAQADLSRGDAVIYPTPGGFKPRDMSTGVYAGPRTPPLTPIPRSPYTNPFVTPEYGIQSSPTNPILSDRPPEIPPGYSETRGAHSRYKPPRRRN